MDCEHESGVANRVGPIVTAYLCSFLRSHMPAYPSSDEYADVIRESALPDELLETGRQVWDRLTAEATTDGNK